MWWQDLLWEIWHGLIAWIALLVHVFSAWEGYPVYEAVRRGNGCDFGFLLGAASLFLGALGGKARKSG